MGGVRGCVEGMGEEEAVGTWIGMLYACYILYIIYKNESINTKKERGTLQLVYQVKLVRISIFSHF